MTLMVPNQGEVIMLRNFLNKEPPQDLDLKLYKNNKTPAETDTEADYIEANFAGYAAIQLTAGDWTEAPGAPTEAAYPQQTFSSSANQAAQSVYGYLLVQRTSGKLMWAERFSGGPFSIANNGDQIKVTPKITLE